MSGPCIRPVCGGEVHTDGWGTPIQCPASRRCPRCDCPDNAEQCDHCKVCPHAGGVPDGQPTPTPLEEAQATVEDLRYRLRRAREALAGDEPADEYDDRLRQAEIRAAVAEHEAEAYRNQVQALVRELLREREVPEEAMPEQVRVILLHEETP
jgi:hypothetical protein